jgi:hypothetical protein
MFEWLTSFFHKTHLWSWSQSVLQSTAGVRTTAVRLMSSHPSSHPSALNSAQNVSDVVATYNSKVVLDCVWNVLAHAQKPDLVFQRNGRVHLNRRGRQFSRLLAGELCTSACRVCTARVLQSCDAYWLPTPFSCFPFTSPPLRHRVPSHFKSGLPSESVCGGEVTDLVSCYISRNMQSQFPVPRDIKNYFRITIDLCRNCARAVLYSGFPVFVNTKYRPVRRPTQPMQWKTEDFFFLGGKMAITWRSPLFSV